MLSSMALSRSALLLAVGLTSACGSKGSVALSASIQKPSLAVEQLTLGTRLSGGFDLVLEVGPEAPEGSTVSVDKFGLMRADGSSLTSLAARPVQHVFPLRVDKGKLVSVPFVLEESELVASDVRLAVCAEPVHIVGAVSDTLSGGSTTPVKSAAVSASGC
jgi:hypothetical protein